MEISRLPKRTDKEYTSIGDVVEELSGAYPDVTHSSLRFLERERLVEPDRTAGGHRIYSQQHIDRIRKIKEWQSERLTLEQIRARLSAYDELPSHAEIIGQFLVYTYSGDTAAARDIILRTDDLAMPLMTIFEDILKPALYELGERWAAGSITVGQEKEVTALTRDLVSTLSLRHVSAESNNQVIVAACVPGEEHELGLQMVTGILQSRGYTVHYLGRDVDVAFLIERIQRRRPAAVLLSASRPEALSSVRATVAALHASKRDLAHSPCIILGGRIVDFNLLELQQIDAVLADDDSIATMISALESCILAST